MVRQQLFQVPGEQLLLHGEADPGPGFAHVRLDLTDVLDVPAGGRQRVERMFENSSGSNVVVLWYLLLVFLPFASVAALKREQSEQSHTDSRRSCKLASASQDLKLQ